MLYGLIISIVIAVCIMICCWVGNIVIRYKDHKSGEVDNHRDMDILHYSVMAGFILGVIVLHLFFTYTATGNKIHDNYFSKDDNIASIE